MNTDNLPAVDEAWAAYIAMRKLEQREPNLAGNPYWIKHRDACWADWNRLFEEVP